MHFAITDGWINTFGEMFTEWFPYWWLDTWLDELVTMSGRMVWLPIQTQMAGGRGKTRGLRDVAWWAKFFDETRPVREAHVDALLPVLYKDALYRIPQLQRTRPLVRRAFVQRNSNLRDPAGASPYERNMSFDAPADERYLRTKARAQAFLESIHYAKAAE